MYAKHTTADNEITHRHWLLIDADPAWPSGISANEQEHDPALERSSQIREWLKERRWSDPIVADVPSPLKGLKKPQPLQFRDRECPAIRATVVQIELRLVAMAAAHRAGFHASLAMLQVYSEQTRATIHS